MKVNEALSIATNWNSSSLFPRPKIAQKISIEELLRILQDFLSILQELLIILQEFFNFQGG